MRIAVISRNFGRTFGGAESYAVAVAQELARSHEVHIFAQECPQEIPGVRFHRVWRLSLRPRWFNQLLFALLTWCRTRRGYDVVHSHENTWHGQVQTVHVRPMRYNRMQTVGLGPRLVQALRVLSSPRLLVYGWLESARFSGRADRAVVATSETLRQECLTAYPHAGPAFSVITPGAALPLEHMNPGAARRQLGLPTSGPLILFVANDYRRKGLDALLSALSTLNADVVLAVVGKPAAHGRYVSLCKALGLEQRVVFLGPLHEMGVAYAAADLLVHPTLEDTYAMVVLEAMAHGLPVIVSGAQYCGIARDLQDGEQALLLADPHDSGDLARQIARVIGDQGLAQRLRQRGGAFARAHDWSHAALQYETIFKRVAYGSAGHVSVT